MQLAVGLHFCHDPTGGLNGMLFRTDGANNVDNYWQMFTGSSATSQTERFHIRTIPNGTLGSDGYHTYLETMNSGSESQVKLMTAQVQAVTRGTRLGDFCSIAGTSDIVQFGDGTDVNIFNHNANTRGTSFWGTSGTMRSGAFYQVHAQPNVQIDAIVPDISQGGAGTLEDGDVCFQGRISTDTLSYIRLQNGSLIDERFVPAVIGYNNSNVFHGLAISGRINPTFDTAVLSPAVIEIDGRTGALSDANDFVNNRLLFRLCNFTNALMTVEAGGQTGFRTDTPDNRVEINSQSGDPYWSEDNMTTGLEGSSGLRFSRLRASNSMTENPGVGVLSVDEAGDVIYVPSIGICDWNLVTNAGSDDLVMGYTGACNEGNTGIGVDVPAAKLDVFKNVSGAVSNETGVNIEMFGGQLINKGLHVVLDAPVTGGSSETIGIHSVSVGSEDKNYAGYFEALNIGGSTASTGVFARAGDPSLSIVNTGIMGQATYAKFNLGVYGRVTSEENYGYGIGVTGLAEGTYNFTGEQCEKALFGVLGVADAANHEGYYSVGIYGRVNNVPESCSNAHAGYFDGDVVVTEGVTAFSYTTTSDEMFKENIENLQNASTMLMQINPRSYTMRNEEFPNFHFSDVPQVGVIAQEIEEILPSLVQENTTAPIYDAQGDIVAAGITYKSVNYQGFIPYLIAGFQEQQVEMDALNAQLNEMKEQLAACCNTDAGASDRSMQELNHSDAFDITLKDIPGIVLKQNVPNPMEETSTIEYNLDVDFRTAEIIFYDGNGKRVNSHQITTKGKGKLNVFADDLSSGIYSYALVVDGNVVASKKLVKK